MKKKVNGKTVNIDNIEVFEKAAEGLAIGRTATSNITENNLFDSETVVGIVKLYNLFYTSLPYPLYAIDTDIKYAVIGTFIKLRGYKNLPMWVDNGLYVCVDEKNNETVYFVNSTWGLVKVQRIEKDNLDLRKYSNCCGYKDLLWALGELLAGKGLANYYKEFMPEFISACNSQSMVMKWELNNILDFGKTPAGISLPYNKIINLEDNTEYTLDIFLTGTRESSEKQQIWKLDSDEVYVGHKHIKTYGFQVYEKSAGDCDGGESSKKPGKMTVSKLYGAYSIFCTLNLLRTIADRSYFEDFKAFIAEGNLVYEVNQRIFVCKAYKFVEPKEIAKGVEIYTFDRGVVYLIKKSIISRGVKKEIVYSYSLRDANLRLCKIRFVNT